MADDLLPWALNGADLGDKALELGPGPGAATDQLCERVRWLTCVEVDSKAADSLARRLSNRNVVVRCEDATAMSEPDGAFDSVICLSMLHHVPSEALQDQLFHEAARVLRPGGVFVGADSLPSIAMRLLHGFDTFVPADPQTLPARLADAGFTNVQVETRSYMFRFQARRDRCGPQ